MFVGQILIVDSFRSPYEVCIHAFPHSRHTFDTRATVVISSGEHYRHFRSYITDIEQVIIKKSHSSIAGRILVVEIATNDEHVGMFLFDNTAELAKEVLVCLLPVVMEVEHMSYVPVRSMQYFHFESF